MEIKQTNTLIQKISNVFDIKTLLFGGLLTTFGLLSIHSTVGISDAGGELLQKQIISAAMGITAAITLSFIPNRLLKTIAVPFYIFVIILLIAVFFFGTTTNGTRGWFRYGGISLQPAEFAKVAMLLVISKFISKQENRVNNIYNFAKVFWLFLLPFLMINFQPDFGTGIILAVLFTGILFWKGVDGFYLILPILCVVMFVTVMISNTFAIVVGFVSALILLLFKKKIIVYLAAVAIVAAVAFLTPIFYNSLAIHQQKRIDVFLNPNSDIQNTGYNVMQSTLAIGNGGITGRGWQNGTLTQLKYVPMQRTDFIYSVPSEEFGFIGSTVILLFLFGLIYRCLNIASNSKDMFNSTLAFGVGVIFLTHTTINIGMTLGIFPVMGIPLPFISYGGTSLFSNMLILGILMNITRNNRQ